MLSKGDVILKSASDFVGNAIGKSEEITRGLLEQSKGCVLVIDEAYGLYSPMGNIGGQNEPYRESVINTLVECITGKPGEDRAVLLLGYKEEIEKMLTNTNPGLSRRFQLENAFNFEDYDDEALIRILRQSVKDDGLEISTQAANFAVKQLAKARAGPHFGNAGAVKNLLSNAKLRMQSRMDGGRYTNELIRDDFTSPGYTDEVVSEEALFGSLVGNKPIKDKLNDYRAVAEDYKAKGKDPKAILPFNFVFTGSPGTGKTTVARLMGKMFSSLALIPCEDVVEVSASDLVTGYVAQTGKKTRELFGKAKGKVLFIDEAYQLNPAQGGSFMQEAVDEIVKLLTSEDFKGKLVVILAGYEEDMMRMLDVNQGLRSRFTEVIRFENFSKDTVVDMLIETLPSVDTELDMEDLDIIADKLCRLNQFANGRDVDTFGKKAEMQRIRRKGTFINKEDLEKALKELESQRNAATSTHRTNRQVLPVIPQFASSVFTPPPPPPPAISSSISTQSQKEEKDESDEDESIQKGGSVFYNSLQNVLDANGLNSEEGVKQLSSLSPDSGEFKDLIARIANDTGMNPDEVRDLLIKWQGDQAKVREELRVQREEEAMARQTGKKALVPIWRCRVCGRADMPYIACYVQPFVVRYEERDVN